jgi:DNA-binding NarL/FixJ family response regulator
VQELDAESFEIDGIELVVFELGRNLRFPDEFTEAEQAVAQLLCDGLDIESIARRRGVRYRTIANQLASMYRKLGVHSGSELVAVLTDRRPDAVAPDS